MISEVKINNFLALAETKNISAAARQQHITQQALSKQISQLERDLDCTLVVRTPRGIQLTEAGEIMVKTFRSMQIALEHAKTEINNSQRISGKVLNIGVAAGLRPGPFLNPLCREFEDRSGASFWFGQPESFNDLVSWLAEDKFDLVLCTDDYGGMPPELASIPLCQTPLYYFIGRSHHLSAGDAALATFREIPFYLTDNAERTKRILSICAEERFIPETLFGTANPYSTHLMVEWGAAVTFGTGFSTLHLNPAVRAYRLPEQAVRLICVWHPEMASQLTMDFISFLRSACDPVQWYYPNQYGLE